MVQDEGVVDKFWVPHSELQVEANLGVMKQQGRFYRLDTFIVLGMATLMAKGDVEGDLMGIS